MNPKYRIYPSLIDSYSYFLKTEDIWSRYWGNSKTPSKTLEQFEKEQFDGLIDKINRVPVKWEDSELMDRGTAFNEIVDCMINGKNSETMKITHDGNNITAEFNRRTYTFPISICREFSTYFKGAQNQMRVSAILPTMYGDVEVYGVLDELTATCVHDIKTTKSYDAWKYKNYAQRLVYPYCLNENGSKVEKFEFNVLVIKETKHKTEYETLTEFYTYDHEYDSLMLKEKVEELIEFLEDNRELITNKKIFNEC